MMYDGAKKPLVLQRWYDYCSITGVVLLFEWTLHVHFDSGDDWNRRDDGRRHSRVGGVLSPVPLGSKH